MENSLKGYKDENIKNLILKMENGEVPYTLSDLKTFNTEVQERNFEQEYVDKIGELIKREILKDVPESDYRKNAEINYAEQFGDDEPKEEPEETAVEPIEEELETASVPEETKIVPTIKEGDIPPIEVPSEVMRASVPEMLEVTPDVIPETTQTADKLDVLEEVAVDEDIERLRNKTNKQKEKEDRKEKRKQKKKEKNMKKKEKENTAEIPVITEQEPVKEEQFPDDYYEFEAFPFLSFVAGLNKILGWIFFLAAIAGGLVVSVMFFIEKVPVIAGIMAGSVVLGTLLLILFYASAEKISLKLEIERHLRYLDKR